MCRRAKPLFLALIITLCAVARAEDVGALSASVRIRRGPVNGVFVERAGHTVAIYGDPVAAQALFEILAEAGGGAAMAFDDPGSMQLGAFD